MQFRRYLAITIALSLSGFPANCFAEMSDTMRKELQMVYKKRSKPLPADMKNVAKDAETDVFLDPWASGGKNTEEEH